MKKFVCILLAVMIMPFLFSQENIVYSEDYGYFCLKDGIASMNRQVINGKYASIDELTFPYELETKNRIRFMNDSDSGETFLLLQSPYFCACLDSKMKNVFPAPVLGTHAMNDTRFFYSNIRKSKSYVASSELVETSETYSADNLGSVEGLPWVEAVVGSDIRETIRMTWPVWEERDGTQGGIGALIILNGYISFEKPDLYEANNRVKKLRVYSEDKSYDFTVTLEDSPDQQIVFLPVPVERMTVEIVSVYRGSKWDDTCIASIEGLESWQSRCLYMDMLETGIPVLGYKEEKTD